MPPGSLMCRICRLLQISAPLTARQLSDALGVTPHAVTKRLSRLQQRHVVRQVPCPDAMRRRASRPTFRAWEMAA
ncbi:MarR family transcriptional regulator [Deinococcus rufus]|uniref:MarR family transcriptional regulator n=1 Tax=Deinococcus rufus TaxID=2136097 RepID=A0ABV7Z9Q2_9DEIO